MRGRQVAAIIGILLIVGGLALWHFVLRGPGLDDRQQIIRLIADVEQAVEQGKTSSVMRCISDDYNDAHGFDRRMIHRLVVGGLHQSGPIDVVVQLGEIVVEGDRATVHIELDYSLGRPLGMGEDFHASVDVTLQREGGNWKVVRSDGWQGAALQM